MEGDAGHGHENVKLRTDPELEGLVPAPTDTERAELERSILDEGCRDPIVAWRPPGEDDALPLLLDGHTRYAICHRRNREERKVPYQVTYQQFASREEAEAWRIRGHLARRNLTLAGRCEAARRLEPSLEVAARRRQSEAGKRYGRGREKLPPPEAEAIEEEMAGEVREQAARLAGVGRETYRRYRVLVRAEAAGNELAGDLLDRVQEPNPELTVGGAWARWTADRKEKEKEAERQRRIDAAWRQIGAAPPPGGETKASAQDGTAGVDAGPEVPDDVIPGGQGRRPGLT